jgi:hypothetical protein
MARIGHCLLTTRQHEGDAWVEVEWTLDTAIIQTLKRLVPAADRTWDAECGRWLIRASHGISPHAWGNVQRCRPRPCPIPEAAVIMGVAFPLMAAIVTLVIRAHVGHAAVPRAVVEVVFCRPKWAFTAPIATVTHCPNLTGVPTFCPDLNRG